MKTRILCTIIGLVFATSTLAACGGDAAGTGETGKETVAESASESESGSSAEEAEAASEADAESASVEAEEMSVQEEVQSWIDAWNDKVRQADRFEEKVTYLTTYQNGEQLEECSATALLYEEGIFCRSFWGNRIQYRSDESGNMTREVITIPESEKEESYVIRENDTWYRYTDYYGYDENTMQEVQVPVRYAADADDGLIEFYSDPDNRSYLYATEKGVVYDTTYEVTYEIVGETELDGEPVIQVRATGVQKEEYHPQTVESTLEWTNWTMFFENLSEEEKEAAEEAVAAYTDAYNAYYADAKEYSLEDMLYFSADTHELRLMEGGGLHGSEDKDSPEAIALQEASDHAMEVLQGISWRSEEEDDSWTIVEQSRSTRYFLGEAAGAEIQVPEKVPEITYEQATYMEPVDIQSLLAQVEEEDAA